MKSYQKFQSMVVSWINKINFNELYDDIERKSSYDKALILDLLKYVYYYLEIFHFPISEYVSFIQFSLGRLDDMENPINLIDILYIISHTNHLIDRCDNSTSDDSYRYV